MKKVVIEMQRKKRNERMNLGMLFLRRRYWIVSLPFIILILMINGGKYYTKISIISSLIKDK